MIKFIENFIIEIRNASNNRSIIEIKFVIIKINVLIWIKTHNKIYIIIKTHCENYFRNKIEYHINVFNVWKKLEKYKF